MFGSLLFGPLLKTKGHLLAWLMAGSSLLGLFSIHFYPLFQFHFSLFPEALFLDGLGQFFATIILGIGFFIGIYSVGYMKGGHSLTKFFASLGLFQAAMIGLCLSHDWIALVVFWELTSLSSFLLIAHNRESTNSQKGAMRAFLVTVIGGLLLLVAAFICWAEVGSWSLEASAKLMVLSPSLLTVVLSCVILAAMTKSAQVPFQFWLPGAMAAPTPVSAYLHSATLVKAGLLLLMKFYPFLSSFFLWKVLIGVGFATYLVGGFIAITRDDLKELLAYSTIAQLGLIVAFLGFGEQQAFFAAQVHIVSHACFKAALFMCVGIIDHQTHTRLISKLRGLGRMMPLTAIAATLAGLSMMGIPFLNGFVSKELLLKSAIHMENPELWISLVIVGAIATTCYVLRFLWLVFSPGRKGSSHVVKEGNFFVVFPPLALGLLCVLFGIFPKLLSGFYEGALESQLYSSVSQIGLPLKSWFGFNSLFLISVWGICLGVLLFSQMRKASKYMLEAVFLNFANVFDYLFNFAIKIGEFISDVFLNQRALHTVIRVQIIVVCFWLVFPMLGFASLKLPGFSLAPLGQFFESLNNLQILEFLILVFSAILFIALSIVLLCMDVRKRWTGVMALGGTGLALILLFYFLGAPDLVLTQASIEIAALALFTIGILLTPDAEKIGPREESSSFWRISKIVSSMLGGFGASVACFAVLRPGVMRQAAEYYRQHVYSLAGGKNIVNVILVDFRGFDTLGEISVLAAGGICAYLVFRNQLVREKLPVINIFSKEESSWTRNWFAILLTLLSVFGLFVILKGHHSPGGGFIGGLIVSLSLVGLKFFWPRGFSSLKPAIYPPMLLGCGFFIALLSVSVPMIWGDALFRSYVLAGFSTATFFDFGLAILVIGVVMMFLDLPHEEVPEV